MSIINEALKKTEQYIQKNAVKENAAVATKQAPRPILLYILILLVGLVLGNIIFNLLRHKAIPADTLKKTVTSQEQLNHPALPTAPVLPIEEKKIPQTIPSQDKQAFVLNGIFFSDNDGYALINNQIVRENDSVDGATVQKITANSVEINQEGKVTTLSTRR